MQRELTQVEVGYLAGLMDGEGCITIMRRPKRKASSGARYVDYACHIRVGNTSLAMMDWLVEHVGGAVYELRKKKPGNRKRAYHWHLGRREEVRAFLLLLRPYFVVKGPQADLALDFIGLNSTVAPLARADLRERMRGLNARGIEGQNGESAASVTKTSM